MIKAILFVVLVITNSSCIAGTVYQCGNTFQDRPCQGAEQKIIGKYEKDPAPNAAEMGLRTGRVAIGMTPDQVVMVWGDPTSKNTSFAGGSVSMQWCWDRGPTLQCVYFDSGRVTGWN